MRALLISLATVFSINANALSLDLNGHSLDVQELQVLKSALRTRCVLEGHLNSSAILLVTSVDMVRLSEESETQIVLQSNDGLKLSVKVLFDPFTVPTHYLSGLQSEPEGVCRW
tara:strand:- start:242582 stop:242923 length:342 start_codon:yes stop_codon:yes gene_type:complete